MEKEKTLRKLRQAKGLTKIETAQLIDVTYSSYDNYEKSKEKLIKAAAITFYKLAKVLDVTMEELIELDY